MVFNIFNYYTCSFPEPNTLGQFGDFSSTTGKITYFLALGMGLNFGPKFRRSRALACNCSMTGHILISFRNKKLISKLSSKTHLIWSSVYYNVYWYASETTSNFLRSAVSKKNSPAKDKKVQPKIKKWSAFYIQ